MQVVNLIPTLLGPWKMVMMVEKVSLGTLGLLRTSAELTQGYTAARLTMELEIE